MVYVIDVNSVLSNIVNVAAVRHTTAWLRRLPLVRAPTGWSTSIRREGGSNNATE